MKKLLIAFVAMTLASVTFANHAAKSDDASHTTTHQESTETTTDHAAE